MDLCWHELLHLIELLNDMNTMSLDSSSQFRRTHLIVMAGVVALLGALITPAVFAAREAARRQQCENNLKTLALAVQNYTDNLGRFPFGTVGSRVLSPPQRF